MKKIILLTLIILSSLKICYSQDVIVKKSGENIQAKVLEVGVTEIKYLRYDNQSGPTYIILKSDVSYIKYENGQKDNLTENNPTDTSKATVPVVTNTTDNGQKNKTPATTETFPHIFLGIGTGLNNYIGMIGIAAEYRVYDKLYARAGFGIGGWGAKYAIGFKYEIKYVKNWGFCVLYTNSTGMKNFSPSLETTTPNGLVTKKNVNLDLMNASTINLAVGYYWVMRHFNKFYLEFGYAVPLQNQPYKINDGSVLTDNGKEVLRLDQPGGLIFEIGFMFVIH